MRTDCNSVFDCVYYHKQVTEKRLLIDVMILKGLIETGEISAVVWVDTKHQYADSLTKSMSSRLLIGALQSGQL